MPRATSSQRVMPPKMLKRIDLHLRVARDHLERVDDALRVAAAAEVAEVRGPAAGERRPRRRVDIESPAPLPRIPT